MSQNAATATDETRTLDEAWAEVEAALPKDWELRLSFGTFGGRDHYTAVASYAYSLKHYRANVGPARYAPFDMQHRPTPAAALHALALRLQDPAS